MAALPVGIYFHLWFFSLFTKTAAALQSIV